MDAGDAVASAPREHALRNHLAQLSVALTLALRALDAGDMPATREALVDASDAAGACRRLLAPPHW